MKKLLVLSCFLFVSCAESNSIELGQTIVLSGTVVYQHYLLPNGDQSKSAAIALSNPILVKGIDKPVSRVELILSEKDLTTWSNLAKPVRVTCSLVASNLWGYAHVACSPTQIAVGP